MVSSDGVVNNHQVSRLLHWGVRSNCSLQIYLLFWFVSKQGVVALVGRDFEWTAWDLNAPWIEVTFFIQSNSIRSRFIGEGRQHWWDPLCLETTLCRQIVLHLSLKTSILVNNSLLRDHNSTHYLFLLKTFIPALLNKAVILWWCGVIPMVMIFPLTLNRLQWGGNTEMYQRLEGRSNSAVICFPGSHLCRSADVSRDKGECWIWRSDGDVGWLNAKHCYRHSEYIFLLNPHDHPTREILSYIHYPEGEHEV